MKTQSNLQSILGLKYYNHTQLIVFTGNIKLALVMHKQDREVNIRKFIRHTFQEPIMYAKFPFYSVAQIYALSLNTPVAIMLGGDHMYWVVDQSNAPRLEQEGCSLLSRAV